MANVEYESILCVKPQVHVYRIPPRSSNRGYRAADWKLDQPDWTGRLRVVAKGKDLFIKLEDKTSGELFAKCPVEQYPGIAVEAVTDSSRYFVLRIKDDGGRSAFIGIGFEDRGDSFDLNVALQDHFKHLQQEKEAEKSIEELQKGPKLDLGFKEGQTIRINIATKKNQEENSTTPKRSRPKPAGGGSFLPPPPGGVGGIKPPPASGISQNGANMSQQQTISSSSVQSNSNNLDLLLDFGGSVENTNVDQGQTVTSTMGQGNTQSQNIDLFGGFDSDFATLMSSSGSQQQEQTQPAGGTDPWGDFTSANTNSAKSEWTAFN